jgi:hypothetical protein
MLNPSAVKCTAYCSPSLKVRPSTHVENDIIGAQTAIVRGTGGTVIGEMIVAVNIRASQEIKGMKQCERQQALLIRLYPLDHPRSLLGRWYWALPIN